ncbi:hypothetical protein [Methylorubrum aminovorans]
MPQIIISREAMRQIIKKLMIAAFLIACSGAARAEQGVKLDDFVGGLVPNCEYSSVFERFRRSVAARYGRNMDGKRTKSNAVLVVPAEIKSVMGSIASRNKVEWTEVVIPVTGTIRSLPVSAIEFAFGNQNGISVTSIHFVWSKADVQKILGPEIARGSEFIKYQAQNAELADGASIALNEIQGRARLVCDVST